MDEKDIKKEIIDTNEKDEKFVPTMCMNVDSIKVENDNSDEKCEDNKPPLQHDKTQNTETDKKDIHCVAMRVNYNSIKVKKYDNSDEDFNNDRLYSSTSKEPSLQQYKDLNNKTNIKGECVPIMHVNVNSIKVEHDNLDKNCDNEPPLHQDIEFHGIKVENNFLDCKVKEEVNEDTYSRECAPTSLKDIDESGIKVERESTSQDNDKEELIDGVGKGVSSDDQDCCGAVKPRGVCAEPLKATSSLQTDLDAHAGRFMCDVCQKTFTQKGSLKTHLKLHTGERPYTCDVCNKSFIKKNQMRLHYRTHSGEKPYSCKLCDKTFSQKSILNRHVKTHSGVKPYVCDVCNKAFSRSGRLKTHMTTHSGKKPYSCDTCNKTFTDKTGLQRHMDTHTDKQPHTCEICSKTFSRTYGLRAHMMQHTGEKPFPCDVCNKVFYQKFQLTNHYKVHTGERRYSCEVCNIAFAQKSNLVKHYRHMTHLRRLTSS